MATAIDFAKHIIRKCIDDGEPVSNLQLQKFLYFIQKDFLRAHDTPAFYDDFEAWKFGPVVPSVYREFRSFSAMPIFWLDEPVALEIDPDDRTRLGYLIEKMRHMKPWDLVKATHKDGGAWHRAFFVRGCNSIISIDDIREEIREEGSNAQF